MVTLCDIPIFSNGFSYGMIINRVVSGRGRLLCQLEKRPAPWVVSCGRGAEGSVGVEYRQRGSPGWSSKHIQIIPTICVLLINIFMFITFITKKHHWLSRSIKMYQRYHYHSSPWFVFNDFHHKSRISPNQLCTVSPCKYLHYIILYICIYIYTHIHIHIYTVVLHVFLGWDDPNRTSLPRSLRRFLFRSTGAARGTCCCGAGRQKTTSSTTGALQGLILSVVPSGRP